MFENKTHMKIEAYLDGEQGYAAGAEDLLARDPEARAHLNEMQRIREGVGEMPPVPEISDAQFSNFFAGIREGIEQPAPARAGFRRPWWGVVSLAAASLLIAISTLYIFSGGPAPVRASEVEMISTDIDGATTGYEYSDDGNTTVWIDIAQDDL